MAPEYEAWLVETVEEHLSSRDNYMDGDCLMCRKLVRDYFDEDNENFVELLIEIVNRHLMRRSKGG